MDTWSDVPSGATVDEVRNTFIDKDNLLEGWTLVNSYIPIVIILLYLIFVWFGYRWMENRSAFQLNTVLRAYNLFQVAFNAYLFWGYISYPTALNALWEKICHYSAADLTHGFAHLTPVFLYYFWCFLVSKIIDLLDTIFMVLRKKNSHITFLHVYHHTAMVFFSWYSLRNGRDFQAAFLGIINVAVHVIMYSYYFLATFGPSVQKYLWWKQHLTKLQLVQFVLILTYVFLLNYNGCLVSRVFTNIWIFNVGVFLCLFLHFYVKTYILSPSMTASQSKMHKP